MKIAELKQVLSDQPKYRLVQVYQAIFVDLIDDWSKVTALPKDLREKLAANCPLDINAQKFISRDGTVKALFTLEDDKKIEGVLMRSRDERNTVCVSSQVGCPLGCLFCATGQMGFQRNLTVDEIVEQVLFFAREVKREDSKITNIVFMGMGEPFLNYDNVLSAIRFLNDKETMNVGARRFSISTIGIIDGIKRLAKERMEINLAISLHAPNDSLRDQLMPINKKYSIKKVISAVDDYIKITNRQVMFEYLLIKNINDHPELASELGVLMKKPLYVVNLISYNPTGKFSATEKEGQDKFKKVLEEAGVKVTLRHSFGKDIAAACGQLAIK
ncbi:MAG: 23S rRNA (adenine(2503)-C(2))-methyltransferase RlmN [Patescibacteria group bacterium]|jgi:23S rRNA (adenine2503-C2)-methyltransferase